MTLGIDASVAGEYDPQPLPGITRTTEVGDYTVTLSGTLASGEASELTFSVQRNGKSVADLQPYLGAYGHLVALRGGDLAYLHVHPEGEPGDGTTASGPDIAFIAAAPSTGSYRLHLDFQHEDIVRTAQINGFGRQQRPRFRPPERPQPGSPTAFTCESPHDPQPCGGFFATDNLDLGAGIGRPASGVCGLSAVPAPTVVS